MAHTKLPCKGVIQHYSEELGTIVTEHQTVVRFGRTSCSGFEPRIGLEVWLMATRMVPIVGERATLVNLTGEVEAADPSERARQQAAAKEQALKQTRQNKKDQKRQFLANATAVDLSPSWRPGLLALAEEIELPPLLKRVSELQTSGVAKNLGRNLLNFVPCEPWPFADASLVPFAQIDGDEPNLYAVFFHPTLYDRTKQLPVVRWSHDDLLEYVCADPDRFIAAVAQGRFVEDGGPVHIQPELVDCWGLTDPIEPMLAERKWPPASQNIVDANALERRNFSELSDISSSDDYKAIYQASERLEQQYQQLNWRYHVRHIQFQRIRYFSDDG
jgi:hypothetical protein